MWLKLVSEMLSTYCMYMNFDANSLLPNSPYSFYVVAGLHDLHNLGFAHRDVKPDNVLIARSGPSSWLTLAQHQDLTRRAMW